MNFSSKPVFGAGTKCHFIERSFSLIPNRVGKNPQSLILLITVTVFSEVNAQMSSGIEFPSLNVVLGLVCSTYFSFWQWIFFLYSFVVNLAIC